MKLALFFVVLFQSVLSAMTKEEIFKLAAEKHDDANLVEELKIFPVWKRYKIDAVTLFPVIEDAKATLFGEDKIVGGGKYLVSKVVIPYTFEGEERKLKITSIIAYDKENQCYKKWSVNNLGDDVIVHASVSMDKNSSAWTRVDKHQKKGEYELLHETYSPTKVTFKHTIFKDGKRISSYKGMATEMK